MGTLVVQNRKIQTLGPRQSVIVPDNSQVFDLDGQVIMPGLICTHSHIGGWGGADQSGPIQPETRILDAINVKSSGFKRAQAGGLTCLNIMPGSGHLLSGQTVYVKLRGGRTIDDILITDQEGRIAGGSKRIKGDILLFRIPL